jgi:uncharacterized protein
MVLGIAVALPHAGIAPLLAMITPVLSVLIITAFWTPRGQRRALWRGFGMRTAGVRMWWPAVALPVVFLAVGYGTAVLFGIARWSQSHQSAAGWSVTAGKIAVGLVVVSVLLLTEEIGWRGYLLPRMQALLSPRRGAVATGFIHALFHLPLILLTTTYDTTGNRYIVALFVVITITAAGVFYAWLRDSSGSLWPVSIAHGTVNLVFQSGTTLVVTATPTALAYTAGESGLATLAGVTGCAAFLLARARCWRRQVPDRNAPLEPAPRIPSTADNRTA